MALEALKRYAMEQNQAIEAEIDRVLKNNALERPTSDEKGKGNIKPLVDKENVIEALQERLAGVYKEHQENIRRAGQLRAEINKDIQAGEPIYKVLFKAIECISLMTGDRVFYDMNKNNLQTIYGILGEPEVIAVERQEVEQRLKRLMAAYEKEKDPGAKQRIKAAIKAHEEKIKTLE